MDTDRKEAIRAAIGKLDPERDYTQAGLPEVDAVNDYMADGAERVSGAERDAVWAEMQRPQKVGKEFRVRATQPGFLGVYRAIGDRLVVTDEQFSNKWMERV